MKMAKLSVNMEKAIETLKTNGYIDVTYWGASVFSMSVHGNDRTLKALVERGIATKRRITHSTWRYELKDK